MKILIVIDQFDDANNGTTISAKRFAEGLMNLGHEVYVVSTGKPAENKYVVKKLPLPIIVSKIIKSKICVIISFHITNITLTFSFCQRYSSFFLKKPIYLIYGLIIIHLTFCFSAYSIVFLVPPFLPLNKAITSEELRIFPKNYNIKVAK